VSCVRIKQYGNKRKKGYSHHKKLKPSKSGRKKTIDEAGAELICGNPNEYLKDMYYMSDHSEDVNWDEIEK